MSNYDAVVIARKRLIISFSSLETFICQFHLWLGGDTKGLLVLLPFPRFRLANMVFTSAIFFFISNQIATATGELTDWICGKVPKAKKGGTPNSSGIDGGATYLPLTQISGEEGLLRRASASDHKGTNSAPTPPGSANKLAAVMGSLPARCVFIMSFIWAINSLYPAPHPSQGHLLPTH